MKKTLLFAAALVCAATVNAQVFQMDGEAFGLSSEAADVEAGLVWGAAGDVTISNAFATQHKLVDCKNNNYNQVVFNGTDVIVTKNGVQGQDNPKDIDGGNPGITLVAPATGAVVEMEAASDGYVYIVAKLSSNKNYYVFEEGTPVGFTLAMQVTSEAFPESIIKYTAEGEGELNEITDATWTGWPEKVILGAEAEDVKVNGLGVIGFPVYAGCKYLVGAGGSKISWCGVYATTAPCSVVLQGTDAENPVEDFVLIAGEDQPGEPGEEPGEEPAEPSIKTLWTNETGEAIPAWGGTFRFCNEENKTGEEIYAFSMEDWALIKEGTIYVGVELTEASNIRVCDGWWTTTYGGNEHNCIDFVETAEDGTTCLVLNIKEEGSMYDAIDEKHLLFTGSDYTITSISAVVGGNAISNVKAENNVKVIFNVAGQKMDAAKGLSIVNGKVIMVK